MYNLKTEQTLSKIALNNHLIIDNFRRMGNVTLYKDNQILGYRNEFDVYPSYFLSKITDEFDNTCFKEVIELLRKDFQSLPYEDQLKCISGSIRILTKNYVSVTTDSTDSVSEEIFNKIYSSVYKIEEHVLFDIDGNCYGCIINDLPIEKT